MAFNPTAEQKAAINEKGNVLVSAAAGSGKTAVLVERVVSLLCNNETPVSADKLLIVTFTNAAAQEMRSRIEKRLDTECRANPDDIALLKQRQLLSSAKICTIDSFCIDLVRENFERLNISPDFKIAEQSSLKAVNEYVLGNLLNEYYEKGSAEFFALLDLVGAEFDDGNFSDYILKMYEYSRQMAFPNDWFNSLSGMYSPNDFNLKNKWYKYALNKAEETAYLIREFIANTLDLLVTDEVAYKTYGAYFENNADIINNVFEAIETKKWDEILSAYQNVGLGELERARGNLGRTAKAAKDYILSLKEGVLKLFFDTEDNIKIQLGEIYGSVLLLTEILTELDKRLFAEYTERNILTFHNTEHLSLKLLCTKAEDGSIIPAETAKELTDKYYEVMVDEYQDTNDLQNMLFYVLSGLGKRLFAVGDVKQSIYGFRGAKPQNFIDKLSAAVPYKIANKNDSKKIILGNNFRSRKEICQYINFFFKELMTEKSGGIDYNEDEKLIPTAIYPEVSKTPISFDIINGVVRGEDNLRLEARQTAKYIKAVMESGECIRKDEETLRKPKYSDFAILIRNTKDKASVICEELKKCGIPVNYTVEGYAETAEISVFLSLLKVIDNPESDIELLSVLMSPIFGFTAEEMAKIRISRRKATLYSALIFAAENGDEHSKITLKKIEKYRLLSVTLALPKLIYRLFEETDYLNTVRALEDGERRHANLLMLAGYAEQYSADNVASLGGFVRFILKQSENGIKSAASVSGGDTAKIMSIHSSKGLQFPVCIIMNIAADFVDNESKNSALYSTDYGIGFRYFDEALKLKRTTIGREVILDSIRSSAKEEELRLLYVAMTRAEDKLHFVASVGDIEKETAKYASRLNFSNNKPYKLFCGMKSYFKWLMLTSMLHPDGDLLREKAEGIILSETDSHIDIKINEKTAESDSGIITSTDYDFDLGLALKLKENTEFVYPFAELLGIEAKSSVSVLANKAESEKYAFTAKPSFMSEGGITAAERGTATHKIIEFIDFDKTDDLESEIDRLYEWQFISEREAKAVNREKLKAFFESDIFRRIRRSKNVKREMRFLTELPAFRIDPTIMGKFDDENIIVQGAVDLCFEEDGEIVVLDFKTDRTDNPDSLAEAYGEQLSIYAAACEKIFGKRVKEKIIYSFALSSEITVK